MPNTFAQKHIDMDQIEVRGGSKDLRIFRAFTKPAEVTRQSRGFISCLKAGCGPKNPEFIQPVGPIFFPAAARDLLTVLTKNLARPRVHKVDLPTHHTSHGLIPILVLRNLFGGPSLNAEAEAFGQPGSRQRSHYANQRCRADCALICGQSVRESDDLAFIIRY